MYIENQLMAHSFGLKTFGVQAANTWSPQMSPGTPRHMIQEEMTYHPVSSNNLSHKGRHITSLRSFLYLLKIRLLYTLYKSQDYGKACFEI